MEFYVPFGRASGQVGEVPHAKPFSDLSETLSAGREEAAEQPASGQLLQPGLPVLRVAPQPIEDLGQLTRDHSFPVVEDRPV